MDKTLWLDCDGVLLDWVNPFLTFSGLPVTYNDLKDYYFVQEHFKHDSAQQVAKFSNSQMFAELPALADPKLLEAIKNIGIRIEVITMVDAKGKARVNRVKNLTEHYGPVFNDIHFTSSIEDKLAHIAWASKTRDNILVEDNPVLLKRIAELKTVHDFTSTQLCGHQMDTHAILHSYNTKDFDYEDERITLHDNTNNALNTILMSAVGGFGY